MNKKLIIRFGLVILLGGIMLTGYGGMCGPKKPDGGDRSGSSGGESGDTYEFLRIPENSGGRLIESVDTYELRRDREAN